MKAIYAISDSDIVEVKDKKHSFLHFFGDSEHNYTYVKLQVFVKSTIDIDFIMNNRQGISL